MGSQRTAAVRAAGFPLSAWSESASHARFLCGGMCRRRHRHIRTRLRGLRGDDGRCALAWPGDTCGCRAGLGLVVAAMVYALGTSAARTLIPLSRSDSWLPGIFRYVAWPAIGWRRWRAPSPEPFPCVRCWATSRTWAPLPAGGGGAWQSFGLESLLTFFLMFVIMAVATDHARLGRLRRWRLGLLWDWRRSSPGRSVAPP